MARAAGRTAAVAVRSAITYAFKDVLGAEAPSSYSLLRTRRARAFRASRAASTTAVLQRPDGEASAAGSTPEEAYKNLQHIRGVVNYPVPDDFQDLSTIHEPLGALFERLPQTAEEWRQYELPQEQIDRYWRDGYIEGVPVLSEAQVDALLEVYKIFLDEKNRHPGHGLFHEFHANQSGDPENVLLHALGQWRMDPMFHDLVFLPAITVPTSQLLGASVRFWHDQLFAKPPGCGGGVAWHQDYSYWTRTVPLNHMTVHVALDDQTIENGALHYIPGSHRWTRDGKPLPITSDDFADMESILEILTDEERENFKPTPVLLKRGEASFHHGMAVHGSYGNRSATQFRRAAVVNYFADGTRSASDDVMLAGTPVVPTGEPMRGQFWPLVHEVADREG